MINTSTTALMIRHSFGAELYSTVDCTMFFATLKIVCVSLRCQPGLTELVLYMNLLASLSTKPSTAPSAPTGTPSLFMKLFTSVIHGSVSLSVLQDDLKPMNVIRTYPD